MSPFSARAKFSLYYKNIDFKPVKPSSLGGMKSPAFLAVNPIGKIPVLELEDGTQIPESDSIVEYLEDRFPERSLRPDDLTRRAKARVVARIADLYVLNPLLRNGLALMMPISLHRQTLPMDVKVVDREYAALAQTLIALEGYMVPDGPFAMGERPSVADGALTPYLVFIAYAQQIFGRPELLGERPLLAHYLDRVAAADPALKRTREEVEGGLRDRKIEIDSGAGAH
jgi:glutathione S-transferase